MSFASLVLILGILLNGANLLIQIFFIIMFSDLEMDYINPIDLCNKLNRLVAPELMSHSTMTILFALTGQWMLTILNLPLLIWNVRSVINKTHILDATEIFRQLNRYKRDTFVKIAHYLILFFVLLYCMIKSLIQEE
ncbi:cornichon family protein Erv14 [Schizosaccharomyces japonicus yFS275]|uniref:Cornichon family protein Erv14 n=1 Tax=Schizosaccharomyces japonicus (strain yFS275 / FY16936) TaxID=402676 RepID=B6K200_SCHJY|nr:cornichon family protein Erv14 [Schizosaccharomyces japonicus yFS275]EEB07181.1 cornichon family protein Erv14 [Schizosaccharomyces japonicus yFS275]